MSRLQTGWNALSARVTRFFPDHEIHVHSGGQTRFLRISTGLQLKLVSGALLLLLLWAAFTAFMIGVKLQTVRDRAALDVEQIAASKTANRAKAWADSVNGVAFELEQRQHMLDQMMESYFGKEEIAAARAPKAQKTALISPAIPEADPLARIEQRQIAFTQTLTSAAKLRTQEAEEALRGYGINPRVFARGRAPAAMGGPFIPAEGGGKHIAQLAASLTRLDQMERAMLAIPNGAPTAPMRLTSTFGYRSDPFNGRAAMHAGMDIAGPTGQQIMASAAGRVTFAGRASGYGNLVKIDHGHGIETRYGHLSAFNVKPGQIVERGQNIARMGSTGRSTGPHLHFEVRLNGRAMNPRPFLEANAELLEAQDRIEARFESVDARS